MPSFDLPIVDNKAIVVVEVSSPAGNDGIPVNALLDTGSTITGVSPKVIRALGLVPIGDLSLMVASGERVDTSRYRARVDMPVGIPLEIPPHEQRQNIIRTGYNMFVSGLPYQPDSYDVLLGMDFIAGFHMTIYRGRLILSN